VNREGAFEPAPGLDENATGVPDELLQLTTALTTARRLAAPAAWHVPGPIAAVSHRRSQLAAGIRRWPPLAAASFRYLPSAATSHRWPPPATVIRS